MKRMLNGREINLSDKILEYQGSCINGDFYEKKQFEQFSGLIASVCRNKKSLLLLDIGANTGIYSFLPLFDHRITVEAFEPNPVVYDILNENIFLNNLNNKVKTHNLGAWEKETELSLKVPNNKYHTGIATYGEDKRIDSGYIEHVTKCVKLDDFIQEHVDIIKIDTEGAELFVLKGAERILKKDRPVLFFEYEQQNTSLFSYKREEILHYLVDIGYMNFVAEGNDGIFSW